MNRSATVDVSAPGGFIFCRQLRRPLGRALLGWLSLRSCFVCVHARLGVSISNAARNHIAILSHDFPIPTGGGAVLHNASLMRVEHVISPMPYRRERYVLSATDA